MPAKPLKHVTIIGVGLLGGSLGLALKRRYRTVRIAGVGRRETSLAAARKVGAIDTTHLAAAAPAAESDLVILATPVGAFAQHLKAIAPVLKPDALVIDVGSTKAQVVRTAEEILSPGGPFVVCHPMAGSEKKGPAHASADLFDGALCILTPTDHTPPPLADRAEQLWKLLGCRTVRMTPEAHDEALARVSHLPHLLAALLIHLPRDHHLDLAATGLRDMTRLAAGDPEVWRDILATNRREILAALEAFSESLARARQLLADGDVAKIEQYLSAAKTRRDTTIGRKDSRG